ncbi:hypothetical protein RUM44_006734 [Polyplax serrata]|uniref:Uncharacterized protein n=1 Tax=Polyplax serrata TaxID=468196 RepID=A0ABR1AIZ8_POLSC
MHKEKNNRKKGCKIDFVCYCYEFPRCVFKEKRKIGRQEEPRLPFYVGTSPPVVTDLCALQIPKSNLYSHSHVKEELNEGNKKWDDDDNDDEEEEDEGGGRSGGGKKVGENV